MIGTILNHGEEQRMLIHKKYELWSTWQLAVFKLTDIFWVHSKWDISPSEGHFGVKTIMAAILKGRSKPKYSKLAPSKDPSEWRISKGTTDGHFGLPWSFAQNLCMMTAPPCRYGMMTQKGTSGNSCLVPYTFQPFEALTMEGNPFEGIRE